jgi:hypothetical protein
MVIVVRSVAVILTVAVAAVLIVRVIPAVCYISGNKQFKRFLLKE